MDILQQSLKAADILSDDNDDLFGDLGLTFNGPLVPSDLPNDLQTLANQADNLYKPAAPTINQDFENITSFDASQFLKSPAPLINIASATPRQAPLQTPVSSGQALRHAGNIKQGQVMPQQSTVQYSITPKLVNSLASASQPLFGTHGSSTLTTTVAQNISIPTCSFVFSKAPTQTLTSTVRTRPAIPPANAQPYLVHTSISQPVRMSAPIQVVQTLPRHAIQQQQGGTQLVTLVQKPTVMQINSGSLQNSTVTQNVNGVVMPSTQNNVAVLKIATTKPELNLNDPQILKAITANLVQKQQSPVVQQVTDVQQQSRSQFIKLGQSNSLLNVISQRSNQPCGIQGAQQITLPSGQKIVVNNGHPVQICTTQSSSLQQQQLLNTSTQSIYSNGAAPSLGSAISSRKVSQLPIKGIPIASVSIPVVASTGGSTGPAQANPVLTIPVVSKQDGASHIVNNVTIAAGGKSLSSTQVGSAQSSSTVRGLLANAIHKQNSLSSGGSSNMQVLQLPQTGVQLQNGQVVSLQGQGNTPLRLNLTSQKRSQLTSAQLQSILKQQTGRLKSSDVSHVTDNGAGLHQQGNIKPGITLLQSSSSVPVPAAVTTSAVGSPTAERQPVQVFKVDPTITHMQIDEVKKLLTSRTIATKLHCLTKEQQQLVLAFQAQIKTMSAPVQQYYLRNPQLFMQKVLQQTRNGKPFILHVKAEILQKSKPNATVSLPSKSQHPTISLTNESSHRSVVSTNRIITPPLADVALNSPSPSPSTVPKQHQRNTFSVNVTSGLKTGIKRSAPPPPEPPAKVTLVVEQLDCHKKMVTKPDCANKFVSVRDAIRRLVPYHTCNIPSIDQEAFDESDKMFEQMSEQTVTRSRAMINKYHLLRLRDSTNDSCSADMVMTERMFLQMEKAKYAQDKARLKDNPSLITEYFPKTKSPDESRANGGESSSRDMSVDEAGSAEADTPMSDNHATKTGLAAAASDAEMDSSEQIIGGDHYRSKDDSVYESSPGNFSTDGTIEHGDESLLQEAVDSILI